MFETTKMVFGPAKNLDSKDLFNDIFNVKNKSVGIPVEVFKEEDKLLLNFYLCNTEKEKIDIFVKDGNILCVRFDRAPPVNKPLISDLLYGEVECCMKIQTINHINENDIFASFENNILTVTVLTDTKLKKIIIK